VLESKGPILLILENYRSE